jgi:hypothetical protein
MICFICLQDVLFNIVALMVIAFGVASTLADSKCTQDGLTIAAVVSN